MQDTSTGDRVFPPPSPRLLFREAPRLFGEMAALAATAPFLSLAPRGDGHPVLVMPGFSVGDQSTAIIRCYLKSLGYDANPWGLGRNLGPMMPDLFLRLRQAFESVFETGGREKVSIVGWSLGGVYARLLAHVYPDQVRHVITLGSPYRGSPRSTRVYPIVREMMDGPLEQLPINELRRLAGTPINNIPTSSIYSRHDSIVPWQIATEPTGATSENIEVFTGHIGLGVSPAVLFAIADRLSLAEGQWRPFHRDGWRCSVYGSAKLASHSANG
ncbi:MAG: esterase [Candidatus Azotimanducaceae bacterium WSBS_2022_MAG_OTU7]